MMNARSYNVFSVETDHRLVIATLRRANDFGRNKTQKISATTEDKVISTLRAKKHNIIEKMSQCKDGKKMKDRIKQETRIKNCIKRRTRYLETKTMLDEANEIMRTKDNAQSSFVIQKILKKRKRVKTQLVIEKLTKHFSEKFYSELCQPISAGQTTSVESSEFAKAVVKLKNRKAPGPDDLTPQELKEMDLQLITCKLNEFINKKDKILTSSTS